MQQSDGGLKPLAAPDSPGALLKSSFLLFFKDILPETVATKNAGPAGLMPIGLPTTQGGATHPF